MTRSHRRAQGRARRFAAALLAAACGAAAGFAPPARGNEFDYRDPAKAPPSWGQFARLAQYRFESWLEADDPLANRFRAYVAQHFGQKGGPASLVVHAFVNADGSIRDVTFASLGDSRLDADLRFILTRGNVGEAPPPDMLQPINFRLSLNRKR